MLELESLKFKVDTKELEGAVVSLNELQQATAKVNAQQKQQSSENNKTRKSTEDAAKASAWFQKEMEKLDFSLQEVNKSLNISNSNRLLKFRDELKKTGVQGKELETQLSNLAAKLKMQQGRSGLSQIGEDAAEARKSVDHLTRALGPQLTDVFVSLYGGMNPLLVLAQQGGQIADLFTLAKRQGVDMQKALTEAGLETAKNYAKVAQAVGGLFVTALVKAGQASVDFVLKLTGVNALVDALEAKYATSVVGGSKFAGMLRSAIPLAATAATAAITALLSVLAVTSIAFIQTTKEHNNLVKALALSGATMAITTEDAKVLASTMQDVGISTSKGMQVLTEMAKAGNLPKEAFEDITVAAVRMNKYLDVSVEDTVQQYKKLAEDPVKNLIELGKQTGYVTAEQVKQVKVLQDQGKTYEALELAVNIFSQAQIKQAEDAENALHPLTLLWEDLKSLIGGTWEAIKEFSRSDLFLNVLLVPLQTIAVLGTEVWFAIRGIGESLGALGAIAGAVWDDLSGGDFDFTATRQMAKAIEEGDAAREESYNNAIARIMGIGRQEDKNRQDERKRNSESLTDLELINKAREKANSTLDRSAAKTMTLADFTRKYKEEALKGVKGAVDDDTVKLLEQAAEAEWKRAQTKTKLTDAEKEAQRIQKYGSNLVQEATKAYIEQVGVVDNLSNSEKKLKQVQTNPDWLKLPETTRKQVIALWEATDAVETLNQQEKVRQELLKESLKYQEAYNKSVFAFGKETSAIQEQIGVESTNLEKRLAVLGKTDDEIKNINREYERQAKLSKIDNDLWERKAKIQQDLFKLAEDSDGFFNFDEYKRRVAIAEKQAADQRVNVNKEASVQIAEDFDTEFKKIQGNIADVIATALFEGGKEGQKKLKDILKNAFRNFVIDVFINPISKSITGSIMDTIGGSSRQGGASGAMNAVSGLSSIYNIISGGIVNNLASGVGAIGSIFGSSAISSFASGMASMAPGFVGPTLAGAGGAAGVGASTGAFLTNPITLGIGALALGWDSLFGRKLKDAGIQGTFGGEQGFTGEQFEFYKGGLLRSDKTKTSPLDKATQESLASQFTAIKDSTIEMATALGFSSEAIETFTKDVRIGFMGLSEEQIQEKLAQELKTVQDEMAALVVDTEQYAKTGENAGDVLRRLGGSLVLVNTTFEQLGTSLFETSVAGGELASSLIDVIGGQEAFIELTKSYYENFYTQQEKLSNSLSAFKDSFSEVTDQALPSSIYAYRQLMESLDLTTESGQEAYATLLQLAPAFSNVMNEMLNMVGLTSDSISGLFQSVLDEATSAQEARQLGEEKAAQLLMDSITGVMVGSVTDIVMQGIVGPMAGQIVGAAALAGQQMAVGGSIGGQQLAVGGSIGGSSVAAGGQVAGSALAGIVDQAIGTINAMQAIMTDPAFVEAFGAFTGAIGEISAGLFTGVSNVQSSFGGGGGGGVAGGGAGGGGGGGEERDVLKDTYDALKKAAEAQKDLAEAELDRIMEIYDITVDGIKRLREESQAFSAFSYREAKQFLSQATSDILAGLLPDVEKYDEAVNALIKGVEDTQYASRVDQERARMLLSNELQAIKDTLEPRKTELELQIEYLDNILKTAKEQYDQLKGVNDGVQGLNAAIAAWASASGFTLPAFANGGSYPGGMALVGERGPELINFNQPGFVYSANQTRTMLDNGEVVSQLSTLNNRIEMLEAAARSTAVSNNKIAKLLDRLTPDGQTIQVSTAPNTPLQTEVV